MEIFYVEKVNFGKELPFPKYETKLSSGIDLYAAISKSINIDPGEYKLIASGIKIKIPDDFEAQVRPRSGLALKYGVTVLNSPGTIDSDYRGEIGIILINHGSKNFLVKPKMRIAQLVFSKIKRPKLKEKKLCDFETARGKKGFGSTGVN